MTKALQLARDLSLPLDVVTQTVAILAKRRAGKSYTMRRLVEQLIQAGQQVVLVDPKGDQWGLRSSADGKKPGLPIVILGGERGDVPLEPGAGELVAKLVVEDRVSALLDLSHFRKHEVATFMTAFLENLYRLKAREIYRTPLMLVVDEADAVAPQKPQRGEERMLGAIEDVVRRGGQRGIGCVLVTQRSAVLNKNVLTQAQILVALRTIAPQDLKAMDEWIQVHGEPGQREALMESLPSLPVGDAWFWSPGWPTSAGIFKRVHVLPIETFDSGATPAPGAKRVEPKNLADVDLEALKKQMATTIERAKADDPRELHRRIAELEKQVRAPAAAPAAPAKTERVEVPILTEKQIKRLEGLALVVDRAMIALGTWAKAMGGTEREIRNAAGEVVAAMVAVRGRVCPPPAAPRTTPRSTAPSHAASRPALHPTSDGLSGPEQRILNAMAELEALGVQQPERVQVAFLAGYTHLASKGFANAMGSLSSGGLITYPRPGCLAMTDEGRGRAAPVGTPRTTEELQERVFALLGGAPSRLLKPLVACYPEPMERTALAAAAGYGHLASKGFANSLGRLRSLGFIDYPGPGLVAAQPVLFVGRS